MRKNLDLIVMSICGLIGLGIISDKIYEKERELRPYIQNVNTNQYGTNYFKSLSDINAIRGGKANPSAETLSNTNKIHYGGLKNE